MDQLNNFKFRPTDVIVGIGADDPEHGALMRVEGELNKIIDKINDIIVELNNDEHRDNEKDS